MHNGFYRSGVFAALLLFLSAFSASAQWIDDPAIDSAIREGIEHTYNLSFEEAVKDFQKVQAARPDHPAGQFFLAMVEWWRILINMSDESRDEQFYGMLEKVIDLCDARLEKNEKDLTALFFKGGAIGFRGRLLADRKSWFKAAGEGKDALPIVLDAAAIAPKNADILLGTGIYNYYASVLPDRYPLLKPIMLFFPKGDRKKGIEQLRQAGEKARYANYEALFFLAQLYYGFENNPSLSLQYAERLFAKFPQNAIFQAYVGRSAVKLGNWKLVNEIFSDIARKCAARQRGYGSALQREAEYYLGFHALTNGLLDEAVAHFVRCDEISRALDTDGVSSWMVMTNLRMGCAFDLGKKRSLALKQYDKVLAMKDFENAHFLAEKYKKQPYTR